MGRRKRRDGEGPLLLEVMMRRVGFRRSYKVALHIACWLIVSEQLGREPETVEEYADWWRMSRATAFRDQASFRDCFPECATPSDLWARLPDPPPIRSDKDAFVADVLTTRMAA